MTEEDVKCEMVNKHSQLYSQIKFIYSGQRFVIIITSSEHNNGIIGKEHYNVYQDRREGGAVAPGPSI